MAFSAAASSSSAHATRSPFLYSAPIDLPALQQLRQHRIARCTPSSARCHEPAAQGHPTKHRHTAHLVVIRTLPSSLPLWNSPKCFSPFTNVIVPRPVRCPFRHMPSYLRTAQSTSPDRLRVSPHNSTHALLNAVQGTDAANAKPIAVPHVCIAHKLHDAVSMSLPKVPLHKRNQSKQRFHHE